MNNINLNIDEYTTDDLLKLFSLQPGFQNCDVSQAKNDLKCSVPYNNYKLLSFLENAEHKLLNSRKQGTWAEQQTHLMTNTDRVVIKNQNSSAGFQSKIAGGSLSGSGNPIPGWLNPLNVRTISQAINIDSIFRDRFKYPSPFNFSIELPVEQRKVIRMRVAYIGSSNFPPNANSPYFFLGIKDGTKNTNNNFIAATDNGTLSTDIFTRVESQQSGGTTEIGLSGTLPTSSGISSFDNTLDHSREYFGPVTIRKLDLYLTNSLGYTLQESNNNTSTTTTTAAPGGSGTNDSDTSVPNWSIVIIFDKLYD